MKSGVAAGSLAFRLDDAAEPVPLTDTVALRADLGVPAS